MNRLKTIFSILTLVLSAFAMVACDSDDNKNKKLVTFHIATKGAIDSGIARETLIMPVSGMTIIVEKNPFAYSGDLVRVDIADVNLPAGGTLRGFLFSCQPRGLKKLLQATGANMAGYIVVKYDGQAIGLRQIDAVITDGRLFACSELPSDKDLFQFADELNESITNINEIKQENESKW